MSSYAQQFRHNNSVREENLKSPLSDRTQPSLRGSAGILFLAALLLSSATAIAQESPASKSVEDPELADSVRELRQQVQELRAAVAEIKAEASQYRAESEELRKALRKLQATSGNETTAEAALAPASVEQRLTSIEENTQLLQSEVRTQYQTKVESASKYRMRLSGMVLLNVFSNHGGLDNMDFPTWAIPANTYSQSSFGATLRQSEFGVEVFGPQIAGARSSGHVQLDFAGGFPQSLDGVNTGLVRLRTADLRLDWENTSLVAGQDNLFISPGSPTSFASVAVPSLGYSGNLWGWIPQVRIEHKFNLGNNQNLIFQGGILDNITGEFSPQANRQPQAGEKSGQPAYAGRIGWNGRVSERNASMGVSGYYSPQNWGHGWKVNGWAIAGDLRLPISRRFEYSAEVFRGLSVGGIGGALGQSVLFSGNPASPSTQFRPINAAGGWSQIKWLATSRLEFNGAFGIDNPFAADVRAFPNPVGTYPVVFAANRSEMANFIFRPRSDLLFSGEYRHLRTSLITPYSTADQINLIMGVLF
jgi:hypothetical protein